MTVHELRSPTRSWSDGTLYVLDALSLSTARLIRFMRRPCSAELVANQVRSDVKAVQWRKLDGTFDGEDLAMPLAFGPNGLVATVEFDAMGVPTVVVSRLPEMLR